MGVSTYLAKVDRLLSEGSVETFNRQSYTSVRVSLTATATRYNRMVELAHNNHTLFSTINIGGIQIPGSDEVSYN